MITTRLVHIISYALKQLSEHLTDEDLKTIFEEQEENVSYGSKDYDEAREDIRQVDDIIGETFLPDDDGPGEDAIQTWDGSMQVY